MTLGPVIHHKDNSSVRNLADGGLKYQIALTRNSSLRNFNGVDQEPRVGVIRNFSSRNFVNVSLDCKNILPIDLIEQPSLGAHYA